MGDMEDGNLQDAIAIIGLGCRFPGASDSQAFWRLLRAGASAIRVVPSDRWDADAWYHPDSATPGKMNSKWGGFIDGIDQFDADFFGFAPREADLMCPQQRLLLEVAWEAIEDAAIAPASLAGSDTGVFMGVASANYATLLHRDPNTVNAWTNSGGSGCIAANRISYALDLHGPSLAVDTACSSSLVAVHLACQSLRAGECTTALAGGVNAILIPGPSISLTKAGVLSPDGQCRVFDAKANGYVRGEGAGVVVMKRLSRALADGDPIYAVLRGSAVHQGGRTNGLMAPSRWAQEAVIRDACRRAGITPGAIQYVEAHSSGSPIGDATELNALATVRAEDLATSDKCAIGSVKPNIGHLEGAAGIAGLIKVVLMLHHRQRAPTLNFESPNVHVPFASLPLRVQQTLQPWDNAGQPLLSGVSASGYGGVNAHVILESAPPEPARMPTNSASGHVLKISARNPQALHDLAARYVALLDDPSAPPIGDVCFTADVGRNHYSSRLAVLGNSANEIRSALSAFLSGVPSSAVQTGLVRRGTKTPADEPTSSLPKPAESARRYVHGGKVEERETEGARRAAGLPAYPFQRRRHWVSTAAVATPNIEHSPAVPAPAASDSAHAPSNAQVTLAQIFREILGTHQVSINDNFFELGGGSIMALELLARIEKVFGVKLNPAALFERPTIAELALVLPAGSSKPWESSLVSVVRAAGKLPPLFILTPGHLFHLTGLIRRIAPGRPVYAMAFPDQFATPGVTFGAITDAYLPELERLCPEGRYHLFGYCAGGVVAFEMAQRLIAQGRPPASLGMVDSPCPPRSRAANLGRAGYFVSRIGSHSRALFRRGPRDAISYLIGRAKFLPTVLRLPGFRNLRPEQLAVVAHREALHRYRPAPIAIPVDLYLATEPWPSAAEDTRRNWLEFAPSGQSHLFSGTHEGILKDPAVVEVANRLNAALEACDSGRSESRLTTESERFDDARQKAFAGV